MKQYIPSLLTGLVFFLATLGPAPVAAQSTLNQNGSQYTASPGQSASTDSNAYPLGLTDPNVTKLFWLLPLIAVPLIIWLASRDVERFTNTNRYEMPIRYAGVKGGKSTRKKKKAPVSHHKTKK